MFSHSRTFQKQQESAASPRSDRIWKPFWVLWMLSCWFCFSSVTGFNSPSLSFRTIILLWFFTPCCSRVWSKTHTHTHTHRSHDLCTWPLHLIVLNQKHLNLLVWKLTWNQGFPIQNQFDGFQTKLFSNPTNTPTQLVCCVSFVCVCVTVSVPVHQLLN